MAGVPRGLSGQGPAARAHPTAPARSGAAEGAPGAAPALGIGLLPGDGPRLGCDVGPWVGWALWGP